MVVKVKQIFERVASDNNIPLEEIESIGNAVFKDMHTKMNSPVDLAYELPWVGTFAVRFKRFESYFLLFLGKLQRGDEKAQEKLWANPKLFQLNADLYQKIQLFRIDRKAAKIKRDAATKPTSQNQPAQHS
jgi:hypothetical protein